MPKNQDSSADYEKEWSREEDSENVKPDPGEQARDMLALEAMGYVNESIRMRNASGFSEKIKRAHQLYNAVSIDPADDLLDNFEGTRTSMEDGSKVVQNIVRQITNDGASQLGDMLYPVDTENWGINALYPAKPPLELKDEPSTLLEDAEGNPLTIFDEWKARKEDLKHRVERMRTEIRNDLARVQFGKLGRKLIFNAARDGTSILKGPFVDVTKGRRWAKGDSDTYTLHTPDKKTASFKVISALDFLPEMAAEEKDQIAYASTREWFLPRALRRLKGAGYNSKSLDLLLIGNKPRKVFGEGDNQPVAGPAQSEDTKNERLSIKDAALVEELYDNRYEVFETWADFKVEYLRAAGVKGIPKDADNDSYLTACVIHCEGYFLKAFLNKNPSGDMPFHIWNWEEDSGSIFGNGIPILAETCQLIFNAAWRMILDHGGIAAVPMVVMAKDKVEPADQKTKNGKIDYTIRGGKVWLAKSDMLNLPDGTSKAFEVFDIPIHIEKLFLILDRAEEDAYKLTGVTRVEKNEQGVDNAPVTLGATQIFQNNASVARRRQVRDFDDEITKSAITQLYDWKMRYEEDDDFKGPMEIEPRGSSVLMQREVNTQNLMNFLALTANGSMEGIKTVDLLRKIEQGMQFPEGSLVESPEETEERLQIEAENPAIPPEVQVEYEKIAAKKEVDEANVEVNYMNAMLKEAEVQATTEQKAIDSERLHYREMYKIDKLSETDFNKHMTSLEIKQQEVHSNLQAKFEDIQSKRDIAASETLSKESPSAMDAEAKLITAIAKAKEADTKRDELDRKTSGEITDGI